MKAQKCSGDRCQWEGFAWPDWYACEACGHGGSREGLYAWPPLPKGKGGSLHPLNDGDARLYCWAHWPGKAAQGAPVMVQMGLFA